MLPSDDDSISLAMDNMDKITSLKLNEFDVIERELSLEDIEPGGDAWDHDDMHSQADVSMMSFDSNSYANIQGMTQWELLMKITDERRMVSPKAYI